MSTTVEPGLPDRVGGSGADTDASGAGGERPRGVADRGSDQLGATGDGTRRLLLFGGVALLAGAVVVAFTGRDRPQPVAARVSAAGPRGRARPRRELDGWEDGVPLAPGKRALARQRLGITSADFDDGPGA